MERRWKVASIGGIPIYITVPWLIFAAFVVYGTYESLARRALTDQQALWWSVVNAVLFYGSIIFHELARGDRPRVRVARARHHDGVLGRLHGDPFE